MMNKIVDLICASEVEEFFYREDDVAVSEGEPVGVDIDNGDQVDFILFDHIYWSPKNEIEEV